MLGKAMTIAASLVAWSALVIQYVLLVQATWDGIGPALATVQFFSYFTILSNLLVAVVLSLSINDARSRLHRAAKNPCVRGAVAVYISITGCIYFFVLSTQWAPQGWQWLTDIALHYVVPTIYLAWWVTSTRHGSLRWTDAVRWLVLPLVFLIWVFVRGAWLGVYPYSFVDVAALGVGAVITNSIGVCLLFVAVGLLFVAIDRWLARVPA